jgi:hypothetical protein
VEGGDGWERLELILNTSPEDLVIWREGDWWCGLLPESRDRARLEIHKGRRLVLVESLAAGHPAILRAEEMRQRIVRGEFWPHGSDRCEIVVWREPPWRCELWALQSGAALRLYDADDVIAEEAVRKADSFNQAQELRRFIRRQSL